jgi:DNA polymerase III epsilon subunit-like protein
MTELAFDMSAQDNENTLFFDTESTGIPVWDRPSGHPVQPHIVELAAVLESNETGEVVGTAHAIIKPDGWVIPPDMTEIHGISMERAMDEGIPEREAVWQFLELYRHCSLRVAHNTTFDNRMIRIGLKRFYPEGVVEHVPDKEWKNRELYFCTLQAAKKDIGGRSGHTLAECYKHYTGKDLADNHSAVPDTEACREIYHVMKKRGLA